jgi:hypothetical protein
VLDYLVKPIVKWPGELTPSYKRQRSPFSALWGKTLVLLERELKHLRAKNVILQMAIRDVDLRIDGRIKANARPAEHPGVIITFNSTHGPMSYWSDVYSDWGANVRAVALSLEALRAIDRYGVNKQGSQYEGYKRLPPATESGAREPLTAEQGAKLIGEIVAAPPSTILESQTFFDFAYKRAAGRLHPDNRETGDESKFVELQEAAAAIKKHFAANQ